MHTNVRTKLLMVSWSSITLLQASVSHIPAKYQNSKLHIPQPSDGFGFFYWHRNRHGIQTRAYYDLRCVDKLNSVLQAILA